MMNTIALRGLVFMGLPLIAHSQSGPDLQRILSRLDQLEEENHKLLDEIHELRRELAASKNESEVPAPPLQERVEVVEHRTDDLAQEKVEASQRLPLTITGMLLFNAFKNSRFGDGFQDPLTAVQSPGPAFSGASVRQTILGLTFNGPDLPGGGKASGTLYMDFFAGAGDPADNLFRIRTATLDLAWNNTTVTFGQDKPIIAPREPDSLAQVGFSPLTGSGNLWDWQPQLRVEQRVALGEDTGIRARVGVYETSESNAYVAGPYANALEAYRPALQGRFELWHGHKRRFEIAPGFHFSQTHIAGQSVPSHAFSLDALIQPVQFFAFTGAFFQGENLANLGAIPEGFTINPLGQAIPVHTAGGWAQLAFFPLPRLSLHFYGGEQQLRGTDLLGNAITRNLTYAGNVVYRLGPNVLASVEVSQVRTTYANLGVRLNNHYDLAMAYLF